MFSSCTVPADSYQEASPSAGKNTRIDLMPCCAWKCVLTAISVGVDIFEVPECHLLQHELSVPVTKITSVIAVS